MLHEQKTLWANGQITSEKDFSFKNVSWITPLDVYLVQEKFKNGPTIILTKYQICNVTRDSNNDIVNFQGYYWITQSKKEIKLLPLEMFSWADEEDKINKIFNSEYTAKKYAFYLKMLKNLNFEDNIPKKVKFEQVRIKPFEQENKVILGITGFKDSGKDTTGNILVDNYDFEKFSFADSLKDVLSAIFGWDRDLLEGNTKESREWREQIDHWWAKELGIPEFTPRFAMQNIGTNVLREKFHDKIWISSLKNKIINSKSNKIVVTDIRFPNEAKLIRDLDGKLVSVSRGKKPDWYSIAHIANLGVDENNKTGDVTSAYNALDSLSIHPSEYSLVGLSTDYQVDNNSDLNSLKQQVDEIAMHLQLTKKDQDIKS